MLKSRIRKWIFLIVGISLLPALSLAYGGFTISSDLSPERAKLLKEDIEFLYSLPAMNDSNGFLELSQMKMIDGPNLHNWFVNRIRYFVSQGVNLELLYGQTGQPYVYDNQNAISVLQKEAMNRIEENVVLASNLGSGLYLLGKQRRTLGTFTINGRTRPILSPRIGVVTLTDAYFDQQYLPNPNPSANVSRLYRLSMLFHESRHSDGNGLGTGFLHEVCPVGHPYAGEKACDKMENGSYGMEARFDKVLSKNCKGCKPSEVEELRMMSLDNFSRIIVSSSATNKLARLQQTLSAYRFILNLCKSKAVEDEECSAGKIKETLARYAEARYSLERLVRNEGDAKVSRPIVDPKPEGFFEEHSVEQTKLLMGEIPPAQAQ